MANKEKIDYLLLDLKELETLIAGVRDAEVYPISFFNQTFNLTHKILNELHLLEATQIEMLKKQMEIHQVLLQSIPQPVPTEIPIIEKDEKTPVVEQVEKPVIQTEEQEEPIQSKQGVFLSDVLEKNNLADFRKAFSLNDRFRFRRELFNGNEEIMSQTIADLNEIHSYEESVSYITNVLKWNMEEEAVVDFLKLLEKRFL